MPVPDGSSPRRPLAEAAAAGVQGMSPTPVCIPYPCEICRGDVLVLEGVRLAITVTRGADGMPSYHGTMHGDASQMPSTLFTEGELLIATYVQAGTYTERVQRRELPAPNSVRLRMGPRPASSPYGEGAQCDLGAVEVIGPVPEWEYR